MVLRSAKPSGSRSEALPKDVAYRHTQDYSLHDIFSIFDFSYFSCTLIFFRCLVVFIEIVVFHLICFLISELLYFLCFLFLYFTFDFPSSIHFSHFQFIQPFSSLSAFPFLSFFTTHRFIILHYIS